VTKKYTPGPWVWELQDKSETILGKQSSVGVDLENIVLSCVRCEACQKQNNLDGFRCGMPEPADAKLIAAAPDLLAACEYVLEHGTTKPNDKASTMLREAVRRATEV